MVLWLLLIRKQTIQNMHSVLLNVHVRTKLLPFTAALTIPKEVNQNAVYRIQGHRLILVIRGNLDMLSCVVQKDAVIWIIVNKEGVKNDDVTYAIVDHIAQEDTIVTHLHMRTTEEDIVTEEENVQNITKKGKCLPVEVDLCHLTDAVMF